jgi:methionine-rich copper-binding protein CopC
VPADENGYAGRRQPSLVLILPLGTALAANASTNSTQPNTNSRDWRSGHHSFTSLRFGAAHQDNAWWPCSNQLLGTDPPERAQLATGPAHVILTFDLPAQRGLSTIIVTGPDGHQWQAGPATEQDTTLITPLRPLGPAGNYTVAWRIISADGHPVRGTFQFTLTTPGAGTPATSPSDNARAIPPATQGLRARRYGPG